MGDKKIIIVRKKKSSGGGHHGGAWKVAYADFVTAMMAFFLVMWILSMDEGAKEIVEGYFNNPMGYSVGVNSGGSLFGEGSGVGVGGGVMSMRRQQERFEATAEAIDRDIQSTALAGLSSAVETVVSDEGLRIEIMEGGTEEAFFVRSSADLTSTLEDVLRLIGSDLARIPNGVILEGHTDAARFGSPDGYSNWELSGDRANAARRILVAAGLPADRVLEVRGYADRKLKLPDQPFASRNRRISILLPYQENLIDVSSTLPDPVGQALQAGGGGGGAPARDPGR